MFPNPNRICPLYPRKADSRRCPLWAIADKPYALKNVCFSLKTTQHNGLLHGLGMAGRSPQGTRWIGRFITAPRDDLVGPDQGKFSAIKFVGLLGRGIDDLPSSGHMPIDRFRA